MQLLENIQLLGGNSTSTSHQVGITLATLTISCHIKPWELFEVSVLESFLILIDAPHDAWPRFPENLESYNQTWN